MMGQAAEDIDMLAIFSRVQAAGAHSYRVTSAGLTAFPPRMPPAVFEAEVLSVCSRIKANPVGLVLFAALASGARTVTIRPYASSEANAAAGPVDVQAATARGAPQLGFEGNLLGRPLGTGAGSDVDVLFSPRGFASSPTHVDTALFHELFHALRQSRGHQRRDHVLTWHNREELLATTLESIYDSAGGRTIHRGSYALSAGSRFRRAVGGRTPSRPGEPPPSNGVLDLIHDEPIIEDPFAAMATSAARPPTEAENYASQYQADLEQLIVEEPAFARSVGAVPCAFNPIGVLLRRGSSRAAPR